MSQLDYWQIKKQRPVILHFVSWYPTKENHVEGIFIQRQIELLSTDQEFQHIVVRKSSEPVSVFRHLKMLMGFFEAEMIGSRPVISIPNESRLYQKYFWRHKKTIEELVLNKLFKRFHPSVVHLHVVYGFAREAVYLKQEKKVPFIISEHMGPFPFDWLSDKEEVVTKPMMQADAVVSVSTAQAKQIESFTGIKATVIPNVIDEEIFRFNCAEINSSGTNSLNLLFVGIYTKAKGIDYLLRVFPAFVRTYPHSVLHLVGDAPSERMKALRVLIVNGGIENNVQFHGRLTAAELSKLHHRCDFYVCSSEWESFGLSALEALFTGLPVMSTNCGGVTDFITSENGLLLENDQEEPTLLKGLLQMTQQLSSYNRKEIAEKVRRKFSNRIIKDTYLSIYKNVLQTEESIKSE